MKKYKLGDILELQRGYDLPLSQQETGNVLVAGSNGIIGSHNEARSNHPCITVGRSGSVGKVHYYEQPTWAHNTTLFVKDFKRNSPQYLYYFLKNLHLDKMFAKGSSVVPSLDRKVVHSLVVPFPKDIVYQKQIASVLSNLDRKIALNRSINHNLEAMAKQLYDYWFVQFDFPDENGKPYKSSGGKMVWNEKLKREIPEGWEVSQLGNICSFRNGINYAKDEVGSPYSIVNVRNISSTSIILDSEDFDVITIPSSKAQNYMLTEKDIVIARSGCPGATRLLQTPNSTLYCGFIICCTPFVGNLRIYLTFLLKSLEGSSATTSGGSILQNVSQETLKSLLVTIPPMTLLVHFDKFLNDIIEQLYSNSKTIKELTKLRDSLLPLLMNGQVSVNYDLSND